MALYSILKPRLPLPPARQRAVSPDFACELVIEIMRTRPARILELGSGVSAIVAAYALEMAGVGTVLSLDHESRWTDKTAETLRLHGLQQVAQVLYAPLVEVLVGGETFPWYDLSVLPPGLLFDMVVVDGPPSCLHPLARYPALPILMEVLSPDAVIILDDAARQAEQTVLERWILEHGPFTFEHPPTEKGMAVLRRGRSDGD